MANAVGYRIWLSIIFLVVAQCTAAQDTTTSTSSDLTVDAFNISTELCRIQGSASVLVNSTLYIDGGDVTVQECESGQTSNCSTWADVNNYFIAISFEQPLLSANWSSLSYQAIKKPKTVPLTTRGILWRNKEGNEFYKFGGTIIGNKSSVNYYNDTVAPSSKIWKFADLSTWTGLTPALSTDWDLQYTSVPSLDKSFAYGSWSSGSGLSSLMVLDSSKSPEVSTRLNGFNPAGDYEKGAMLHLPVEGGDGVLLFIGGSVTPFTGPVPGNPDVPMSTVRLYDIANDTWYNQSTSTDTREGVFPNARHNFCAVLASTGPKSYDIFMYGGDFNSVENESYAAGLWILSIPSFRWFYFADPDNRARLSGSTCQVIGPHFLRFGGWNYYNPNQASGPTCMNALSIFNLNSFTWTDTFDPTETTYNPPTKVAAWNSQSAYPLSGWNDGVQALFASTNSTNSTPTPTPTKSTSPTPSSTNKPASKLLPKVLGSVLGVLLVLALLLSGVLFLVRRKKRRLELEKRFEVAGENRGPIAEMPAVEPMVAELPATSELLVGPPIQMKDKKIGGTSVSELR